MSCIKLLVFFAGLAIAVSHRHTHFYRKDYTFIEEHDAFYKLHWDPEVTSWNAAFLACDDEGAKLFYPKQKDEWMVARTLGLPESSNVSDFFVGIHDEFGFGEFMTVDGYSWQTPADSENLVASGQSCVVMDIESGLYKVESCVIEPDEIRPFICKKVDDRPLCPTIDSDYIYNKGTKKCYKINNRSKVWQDAMHTCYVEGGILAVVENEAESRVIRDMLSYDKHYFAGFHRITNTSDFYTVKGNKFDASGFQSLQTRDYDDSGDCGVISRYSDNLYTGFVICNGLLPFVCEIPVKM